MTHVWPFWGLAPVPTVVSMIFRPVSVVMAFPCVCATAGRAAARVNVAIMTRRVTGMWRIFLGEVACWVSDLAQARAGVETEEGAAADRIPLRSERRCLADHLQVAPHFGQPAPGLERGASAVTEHQVHRLAGAVARVHRGEPAAGALLERGLAAVGERVPELGDHRVAIEASG